MITFPDGRDSQKKVRIIPRGRLLLFLSYLSLMVLAVGFLQHLPAMYNLVLSAITVILGGMLSVTNKLYFCCFIVPSSLLGPVSRIELPGVGMFNIGDALLGVMAISLVGLWSKENIGFNRYRAYFLVMVLCVATNILMSGNISLSISGLLNMAEIAIVYLFTFTVIRTRQQARTCINAFAFGVAVVALVHIYSYTQGYNMNMGLSTEASEAMTNTILGLVDSPYIKASFFYGNFSIACSIVAVIGLRSVILSRQVKLRSLYLWILTILVVLVSGSITARTPLFVVFPLGLLMLFILWQKKESFGGKIKKAALSIMILIVVSYMLFMAFDLLISSRQQEAYLTMFTEDGSESMRQRFNMWGAAIKKPFQNPNEFLFGIGPNVNLRLLSSGIQGENDVFQVDGSPIISFHNFFIDAIFQLGIIFGLSMILLILSTLISLLRGLKKNGYQDGVALDCVLGILAFILAGFTLGAAWSKPYIIVAQLFAISHLLISGRFGDIPSKKCHVGG